MEQGDLVAFIVAAALVAAIGAIVFVAWRRARKSQAGELPPGYGGGRNRYRDLNK